MRQNVQVPSELAGPRETRVRQGADVPLQTLRPQLQTEREPDATHEDSTRRPHRHGVLMGQVVAERVWTVGVQVVSGE